MKKFIILIFIIAVSAFGYLFYTHYTEKEEIPVLPVEKEKLVLSKYYTYATTLNLEGTIELKNYEEIKLTLYNGEFKDIDVVYEDNKVILSEYINEGIYLDDINEGKYMMFLKVKYQNPDNEAKENYKYYVIDNQTEYSETKYHTISIVNNKIIVNSNNDYKTLMLNVEKNTDKEIYDIVIDPGHGGMDGGAEVGEYCENDFTMEIAEKLKDKLEKDLGLKVKLTREVDTLTKNDLLEEYGKHGRAVISHEVEAKYTFSIHFNSNKVTSVNGLEIYTSVGINYDFSKSLVEKIVNNTGIGYSRNKINKIYDSIYSRNFTETEITKDAEAKKAKAYEPYDITTNSNYFYMIRETGGVVTGAYVDDRNEEILPNPYYKSNVGSETYLLEFCYITNPNDLNILLEKEDNYIDAVTLAIKNELNIK